MRNTHTCRTFAKWNVHTHGDEQTASIKSIHVAGDRVLTLAESGAAIVSKFPASVVEAYSDDEERMYTYHLRNQNSDDDELSPLWEHDEIVNVEMDQACVSVVATIDDIERSSLDYRILELRRLHTPGTCVSSLPLGHFGQGRAGEQSPPRRKRPEPPACDAPHQHPRRPTGGAGAGP